MPRTWLTSLRHSLKIREVAKPIISGEAKPTRVQYWKPSSWRKNSPGNLNNTPICRKTESAITFATTAISANCADTTHRGTSAYLSEKLENLNIIINNNAATAHAKLSKKDRKYNVTISSLLDVPKHIDLTCTFKNPNMLESPFSERLARP